MGRKRHGCKARRMDGTTATTTTARDKKKMDNDSLLYHCTVDKELSLYWYIVWLASLDRSCANRRMKQVTQSTEPCQKWFAGSWKVTDPCGNLGETKFASPIKLSRKKEVFWWRSSAVYQWGARRKAFRPMRTLAAGCWTNQSGSLLGSMWKNVASRIGQTVNLKEKRTDC